mmetsp:Transcript_17435/g.47266  ORF Transcript_17435/g.47266 Transcript_17435/m.47266 type:complete len:208 (-) Transcript_17435:1660-2283(-)
MTGSVLNEVFLNSSEKCESALTSPVQPPRNRVGDREEGEESNDEARDDPPKGEDPAGDVPRCEVPSGDVTGVKFVRGPLDVSVRGDMLGEITGDDLSLALWTSMLRFKLLIDGGAESTEPSEGAFGPLNILEVEFAKLLRRDNPSDNWLSNCDVAVARRSMRRANSETSRSKRAWISLSFLTLFEVSSRRSTLSLVTSLLASRAPCT